MPVSTTQQFTATVTGSTNTAVTWSVNGVRREPDRGHHLTGLYTAPAAVPARPTSRFKPPASRARRQWLGHGDGSAAGSPPVTVSVAPPNVTVAPSATQQFTATVTNSTNTGVTWSVNGSRAATRPSAPSPLLDCYTAPAVAAESRERHHSRHQRRQPILQRHGDREYRRSAQSGDGTGHSESERRRVSWSRRRSVRLPADIAHVQQVGINAWLTEQFNMPETPIVDPGSMNSGALQSQYLSRLSQAPDQLRQRVAYALSQIIVISMNKNIYPDEMVPYLQILSRDAFGNYRTLLGDISVSSQMGKYLDLARSTKPGPGGGANENYAREVMQLFTIGLYMLNPDGSQQLDAQGHPIPTYDQTTIQQVALALTGWVYKNNAWEDFTGPMVPQRSQSRHDAEDVPGLHAPGGPDHHAGHERLPRLPVQSSQRGAVHRHAADPQPGDQQSVAGLHPARGRRIQQQRRRRARRSARRGHGDPDRSGSAQRCRAAALRPPEGSDLSTSVSFVRALNGSMSPTNGLPWLFSQMAQTPLTPPSVFSFFSPLYRIPKIAAVRSGVPNLHAHRIGAAREFPVGDHFQSRDGYSP